MMKRLFLFILVFSFNKIFCLEMSKELLVDQFVAITGADPDAASHFLESCGGDVQRAVDLFFHHGNNEVDKSSEPGPSSVSK